MSYKCIEQLKVTVNVYLIVLATQFLENYIIGKYFPATVFKASVQALFKTPKNFIYHKLEASGSEVQSTKQIYFIRRLK